MPLLFRLLRIGLIFLKRLAVVLARTGLLTITGLRRLRVEQLFVNKAFLLSNGLVIIYWRAKNALWISVQGRWAGCQREHMLVYPLDGGKMLSVRIQGLLSSHKEQFNLCPLASVDVPVPAMIGVPAPAISDEIGFVFSPILSGSDPVRRVGLTIYVPAIDFNIPSFQTENNEQQSLLRHAQLDLSDAKALEGGRR